MCVVAEQQGGQAWFQNLGWCLTSCWGKRNCKAKLEKCQDVQTRATWLFLHWKIPSVDYSLWSGSVLLTICCSAHCGSCGIESSFIANHRLSFLTLGEGSPLRPCFWPCWTWKQVSRAAVLRVVADNQWRPELLATKRQGVKLPSWLTKLVFWWLPVAQLN